MQILTILQRMIYMYPGSACVEEVVLLGNADLRKLESYADLSANALESVAIIKEIKQPVSNLNYIP